MRLDHIARLEGTMGIITIIIFIGMGIAGYEALTEHPTFIERRNSITYGETISLYSFLALVVLGMIRCSIWIYDRKSSKPLK